MQKTNFHLLIFSAFLSLTFSSCKSLDRQRNAEEPLYVVELDEISVIGNPRYKASATKYFDLKHTKLELVPQWKTRTLDGIAVLTFSPFAYPQDTLVLDAKSFEIKEVFLIDKNDEEKAISHIYDQRKMLIPLGRKFLPGEEFKIKIKYTAYPEKQEEKGIIDRKADKGLYFIDPDDTDPNLPRQLWTQGEVRNNSAWFPTIDEPNQKFTQEIFLTVDSAYETLSNGALIYSNLNNDGTRTDYWQQEQPHSPYLVMIAVGDWHIEKDNWRDSIPVEYYVEHEFAPYAKMVFGNTPEMMEYYSRLLGVDYPWAKYSQLVVRNFVSGAMENTTASIFFEDLQHDERAHLDETYESIIAHELFHHWFGDYTTAESWSNLALNESLATYGERIWEEYKYGADAAAYGRQQDLDAYLVETVYTKEAIINYYYNDPEDLFDRHRYEKGGLVLHMLRNILGDEVFYRALNNFLLQNAHKNVEINQLRIAFEEASGQDLNWFFDQWFLKAGHPKLVIRQKYNAEKKKLSLIVEQTQSEKNVPFFKMPVNVHIYLPAKMLQHKIWLGKGKDSFIFDVEQAPLLVNFDAEKYLLAQKAEKKPVGQWYHQFMFAKNYSDKYEALQALANNTKFFGIDSLSVLINKGLADSFWNIRRITIDYILLNSKKNVQEKYVSAIKNIAAKDKNSIVRNSAYLYMQNKKAFFGDDIYAEALKDSSYKVVTSSINGLRIHSAKQNSGQVLQMVEPYENYKNKDVLFAIAYLYAELAGFEKIDFFRSLQKKLKADEYGRFIDAYAKFMDKRKAERLLAEKDFILSLEPNISDIWSKMSYKTMLLEYSERLRQAKDLGEEGKNAAIAFKNAADKVQLNSSD